MNICLYCAKETENAKFCDRSCSASFNNKAFPKRKLVRICSHENCNSIIRNYRSTLCQNHWDEHKEAKMGFADKTLGEYINLPGLKLLHNSSRFAYIRNFARSWLKHLLDLSCFNCGYSKHKELCHIKPISEFSNDSLLSEINCEYNVLPLCPNCHWEFDNNQLDRQLLILKWRSRQDLNLQCFSASD